MLIKNLYLPSLIFSFNECDHHDGPSFAILTLLILLELEFEVEVDFLNIFRLPYYLQYLKLDF